jgi:hypothetical protein
VAATAAALLVRLLIGGIGFARQRSSCLSVWARGRHRCGLGTLAGQHVVRGFPTAEDGHGMAIVGFSGSAFVAAI